MPTERTRLRIVTVLLGVFLLLVGLGLGGALLSLWPVIEAATAAQPTQVPWTFLGLWSLTLPSDTALLLLVVVTGGLGSMVHAATSFATYVGNRRLTLSWCWWYLLRMTIGATMAVLVYFLLRGGLLTGSASSTAVNPYGIAAVAGLAGMFAERAVKKLAEVFDALLGMREGAGDDQRADKVASPEPVLEGCAPDTVTPGAKSVELALTGRSFTTDSRVSARRPAAAGVPASDAVDLEPKEAKSGMLRVVLPDDLTATAGSIEITVSNPPPGGGQSATLTVTVTP